MEKIHLQTHAETWISVIQFFNSNSWSQSCFRKWRSHQDIRVLRTFKIFADLINLNRPLKGSLCWAVEYLEKFFEFFRKSRIQVQFSKLLTVLFNSHSHPLSQKCPTTYYCMWLGAEQMGGRTYLRMMPCQHTFTMLQWVVVVVDSHTPGVALPTFAVRTLGMAQG